MERTDQDFQDGLALDILSPKPRTLVVTQNKSPLAAIFMTGATGAPFVAVSNYSYIIKTNETANDLIAKIEIPYDPVELQQQGLQEANTFVATLASDGKSWVVNDQTRNVHRSENNTRIVKMTSIEGEYILVARKTVDTSNVFVQYGQGATRTVNLTAGPGLQCAEFIDGMRFTVQTNVDLKMNIEIKDGVNPGTLPPNTVSLNSFMWIVNTSVPMERVNAEMLVPCSFPFLYFFPFATHRLIDSSSQQNDACSNETRRIISFDHVDGRQTSLERYQWPVFAFQSRCAVCKGITRG